MPEYHQHPDELIKKSDRNKAATSVTPPEPVAPDPIEEAALDQLKKELPDLLFGNRPPKKEEPKVAAAPPATPEPPVAPVDPNAPAIAAPPVDPEIKAEDKKTKARKQPDALEVARATGQAIADAIRGQQPAATEPPAKPADNEALARLSVEDRENYDLFKVLNDSDPKYKGKHDEFLKFVGKLSTYKRKWEKDNPGQSFDSSDDTHEDFYSTNQPQFVESDLDRARIKLETKREVESSLKAQKEEYETKLREIEEKAVGPQVQHKAAQAADEAISKFVAAVPDTALQEALKDPKKLQETDPVAFEVLNEEAGVVRQAITELHNIIYRPNYFNASNPVHVQLATYIDRQEQFIKNLPMDKQVFEGKRFATREEWHTMPQTARSNHWMLTESDVTDMLTASSAAKAVKAIADERKRMDDYASKYGFKKDAAASAAPPAAPKGAAAAPAAPAKPKAPSANAGDPTPPTSSPPPKVDGSVEKQLLNSLF